MTAKTAPVNRIEKNGKPEVPESLFSLDKLLIKVVGITPLLCASPLSMQPEAASQPRGSKKTNDNSPETICRKAAYFDPQGNCAFPNRALYACILDAAELMKVRIGKGRYAPGLAGVIAAGLFFDWEVKFTTLIHPKTGRPLTEKDYAIDMQRAVNQKTGGGIVAIRPRFDEWAAVFSLRIDTSNSDLMAIMKTYFPQILQYAGMSIGLGAFRAYVKPKGEKAKRNAGGPYGKFVGKIMD